MRTILILNVVILIAYTLEEIISGFGLKLRGSKYLGDFGFADAAHLAEGALGDDVGGVDARAFGQQSAVHQLHGVARAVELLGAMANGLSMGAKGTDSTSVELQVTQQLLDQGCIDARDGVAREGRSVQLVGSRRVQGQQLAFELVRKRCR